MSEVKVNKISPRTNCGTVTLGDSRIAIGAGVTTSEWVEHYYKGDIVAVSDYAQTFDTNNCIMLRNGSNIEGAASDLTLDAKGLAMTFVYADSTKGWKVVGAGREADSTAATFIATGGNSVATCGDCKIYTFTGPGTFTVCSVSSTAAENLVSYLVVAGGGSGGTSCGTGGGGAGGFREYKAPLMVIQQVLYVDMDSRK